MLSFLTRQFGRRHFWAVFLASFCHSLYASHNTVHVQIEGVEGKLLKNVRVYLLDPLDASRFVDVKGELLKNVLAYLSIEQQNHLADVALQNLGIIRTKIRFDFVATINIALRMTLKLPAAFAYGDESFGF